MARSEAGRREARDAETATRNRLAGAELAAETVRGSLAAAETELSDTRNRLDAAIVSQGELRGRCEELALASGAFAAEVAKQKEERAKSQERSRMSATASAAELREQRAALSRASETSLAERARLEKELANARAEAQEIDADVAQVLDALASSEKERRRLEGELDRQSMVTEAARRAAKVAEGAAAHAQKDVDHERAALCEKAGLLEGVVQAGASRLKESLQAETKRREQLERECKGLASRVTDLEAALISASGEVRKAITVAAERSARYERDLAAANEETVRLRTELTMKTENVRDTSERAAEERGKWAAEKNSMKEEAVREKTAALAEAAERAYRDGITKGQGNLAHVLDRGQRDSAASQKEMAEMAEIRQAEASRAGEVLAREASLRAQAAREVTTLKRKVAELEIALEKITAAARMAGQAARVAADPMSQLQAEMRSVIVSLQPDNEAGGLEEEKEVAGASPGGALDLAERTPVSSRHVVGMALQEWGDKTGAGCSGFAVQDKSEPGLRGNRPLGRRPSGHNASSDTFGGKPYAASNASKELRPAGSDAAGGESYFPVGNKGDQATAMAAVSDRSSSPLADQTAGRDSLLQERPWRTKDVLDDGTAITPSPAAGNVGGITEAASVASRTMSPGQRAESTSSSGSNSSSRGDGGEGAAVTSQPRRADGPNFDSPSASAGNTCQLQPSFVAERRRETGNAEERADTNSVVVGSEAERVSLLPSPMESSDDDSYSAAQSVLSSTTCTSGLSSSVPPAPAGGEVRRGMARGLLSRSGSVVVRDWKAGQREAFSELDRKASLSGGSNSKTGMAGTL